MYKKAIAGIALLAGGLGLFLASVFYSLPSNVVSDRGVSNPLRAFSVDLAPQGWGFFTKPPAEPDLFFLDAGTLESLVVTPQGRVDNLFGVSRTQRAQGPEGANLLGGLTDEDWHTCELGETLPQCVESLDGASKKVPAVENDAPIETLCGEVLVAQSAPTPWSYRDLTEDTHSPENIVKLSVQCDN